MLRSLLLSRIRRNQNYMNILRFLALGDKKLSPFNITHRFTHLFWLGDLNYRVELPTWVRSVCRVGATAAGDKWSRRRWMLRPGLLNLRTGARQAWPQCDRRGSSGARSTASPATATLQGRTGAQPEQTHFADGDIEAQTG